MKISDKGIRIYQVITLIVLSLITAVLLGIAVIKLEYSLFNQVKFLIYLLLQILLPGILISRFINVKFNSLAFQVVFDFFLGYSQFVILYLFTMYLQIVWLCFSIIFFEALICIILIILKRIKLYTCDSKTKSITLSLISIYLLLFNIVIIYKVYGNIPSGIMNSVYFNHDELWHIGNVNALTARIPAKDPRVEFLSIKYHYFYEVLHAGAKRLFNISSFHSIIQYSSPLIPLLLITSIYGFSFEKSKSQKNSVIYLISVLFCGCLSIIPTLATKINYNVFNFSLVSINSFFIHIITNINAVAYSLPCFLICIVYFNKILYENLLNRKTIISYGLLVFLLTGLKGPFGLALLIYNIISVIIWKIRNRKTGNSIYSVLLITLIIFLTTYKLLLSSAGSSMNLSIDSIFQVIKAVCNNLKISVDMNIQRCIFAIIPHFIFVVGGLAIGFLYILFDSFYNLYKSKYIESRELSEILFVIVMMGAYYLLYHNGFSQLYFLFLSIPFIYYIGIEGVYKVFININKRKRLLIGLPLVIILLFSTLTRIVDITITAKTNIVMVFNINNTKTEDIARFSKDEYEAMIWLKNNTQSNILCASDRNFIEDIQSYINVENIDTILNGAMFYYYSTFSERNFFAEGLRSYCTINGMSNMNYLSQRYWDNIKIYSDDESERRKVITDNDIGYIIVSRRINQEFILTETDGYQVVFANRDVTIYKVCFS